MTPSVLSAAAEVVWQRLDACHHLFCVKGLDHVIVCAQLQTQHLVKGLALGGKHHHRGVARLADAAADLKTVHAGHHHVQQHHIRLDRVELFQSFFAIVCHRDLIALLGQVQPQQLADVGVVVHHKDLFVCHRYFLPFYAGFCCICSPSGRFGSLLLFYYTGQL